MVLKENFEVFVVVQVWIILIFDNSRCFRAIIAILRANIDVGIILHFYFLDRSLILIWLHRDYFWYRDIDEELLPLPSQKFFLGSSRCKLELRRLNSLSW